MVKNFLLVKNFLMVKIFIAKDFYCSFFIPYAAPKLTKCLHFQNQLFFSIFYFLVFQIIFEPQQLTL